MHARVSTAPFSPPNAISRAGLPDHIYLFPPPRFCFFSYVHCMTSPGILFLSVHDAPVVFKRLRVVWLFVLFFSFSPRLLGTRSAHGAGDLLLSSCFSPFGNEFSLFFLDLSFPSSFATGAQPEVPFQPLCFFYTLSRMSKPLSLKLDGAAVPRLGPLLLCTHDPAACLSSH